MPARSRACTGNWHHHTRICAVAFLTLVLLSNSGHNHGRNRGDATHLLQAVATLVASGNPVVTDRAEDYVPA